MDYLTCLEMAYIIYTNDSLIKYGLKKLIKSELGDKLLVETVKYVFKKVNF